jgi:hypothetical protein
MASSAETKPADTSARTEQYERAVYTVSNAAHFLGAVALVNSLRITGWNDEIILVDCGLSSPQRELIEREVRIVPSPPVQAPHLLKVVGPLAHPAGVMVLLDADIIVTRRLDPLIAEAAESIRLLAFADVLDDRFDPRWGDLLGLGNLRRQTYVNSGFLIAPSEFGVRVFEDLREAQTHIDIDRSMVGEGTPEDPFYFPDQDALNAILASSRVRPDQVRVLENALAPNPPFPGVRVVDAERLRVVCDDGREPFGLHHIQRKPWLSALGATPYSQLLPRLWLAADLPVRVDVREVPLRYRPGWTGAAGARYASGYAAAERTRTAIRRRLDAAGERSPRTANDGESTALWDRVEELTAMAPTLADLHSHRLESFEIWRLRRLGLPVPDELAAHELRAVAASFGAEPMLRAAREAYDGRLALIKGYEVALRYPEPWLRPFSDIDLLVDDSAAAQRALQAAGFVEVGDPAIFHGIHHLRPLWLPGSTLVIELHHVVKWPDGLDPPATAELFDAAVPSESGVEGLLTLPDEFHALILAAHSWAHLPLRRLLDLVDIAAVTERVDQRDLTRLADRFGIGRIWKTSIDMTDEVLGGGGRTAAGFTWGRHLAAARDRTVVESHLERWLSPFWAHPARRALTEVAPRLLDEIRPGQGEDWGDKGARIVRASRNALMRRSEHDLQLGPAAHRRRRR